MPFTGRKILSKLPAQKESYYNHGCRYCYHYCYYGRHIYMHTVRRAGLVQRSTGQTAQYRKLIVLDKVPSQINAIVTQRYCWSSHSKTKLKLNQSIDGIESATQRKQIDQLLAFDSGRSQSAVGPLIEPPKTPTRKIAQMTTSEISRPALCGSCSSLSSIVSMVVNCGPMSV